MSAVIQQISEPKAAPFWRPSCAGAIGAKVSLETARGTRPLTSAEPRETMESKKWLH
jgi:hypothetical protein